MTKYKEITTKDGKVRCKDVETGRFVPCEGKAKHIKPLPVFWRDNIREFMEITKNKGLVDSYDITCTAKKDYKGVISLWMKIDTRILNWSREKIIRKFKVWGFSVENVSFGGIIPQKKYEFEDSKYCETLNRVFDDLVTIFVWLENSKHEFEERKKRMEFRFN